MEKKHNLLCFILKIRPGYIFDNNLFKSTKYRCLDSRKRRHVNKEAMLMLMSCELLFCPFLSKFLLF